MQSWDTASKDNPFADWSVCVTAHISGQAVRIVDVYRARLQFPELKAKAIELARLHQSKVLLIEDAASGQQLIQTLRAEELQGVPAPIARRPEGDKLSRVMGVSAMIEAGRLFLPDQAHWGGDYKAELPGFPPGKHDDQVDATAQLLAWVQQKDMYRPTVNAGPELVDPFDRPVSSSNYDFDADPWGA